PAPCARTPGAAVGARGFVVRRPFGKFPARCRPDSFLRTHHLPARREAFVKLRRARVLDTANAVNAPCTPLLYFDAAMNSDAARLLPAEYFATDRKLVLVTVLGSCVAACLRDPILGVGGMNHFMLPD